MRKSVLIALLIAGLAGGWVAWGEFTREPAVPPPDAAERVAAAVSLTTPRAAVAVQVRRSEASPFQRSLQVTGRTEAKRVVQVMSELDARVIELPVEKGQRVRRGDVLARLAIDDRDAWLAEAKAQLRQREIEFNAAEQLNRKGYRSETQFAATSASLDQARAQVRRMEVELSKTTVRAPFDGVVDERPADLGAFLKVGSPIAKLVDEQPFLVVAHVSENDVGQLSVGDQASARVATGETVEGRIAFIATAADPATRTFRVDIEVPNPDRTLRDGVTARVSFPVASVLTHLVSPAILTLDEAGLVGVRAVDADDTVRFHPVEIVAETDQGVRLAGLPETVDLIVVGHEFVRAGETVQPKPALPAEVRS